ncbi:type II toxin-antitoxin system VapC family toxin [Tautonia rosea]|uniref:type II toxin-antitoxin system VapC family toxin n=1 Tax=Tautonia rosea TaxID=2728037 RepID=UPI00147372EC|nr:PIN domain-containing protein [Tautonia rosea]
MIFVDTGAWYSRLVPSEVDHLQVVRWLATQTEPLLTTDYVVDETLTLFRSRGHTTLAIAFGDHIFRGDLARLYVLSETEIRLAWETFRRFDDKGWSFTDCTSKVVIERLEITTALALDQHFRQFGSVTVVP